MEIVPLHHLPNNATAMEERKFDIKTHLLTIKQKEQEKERALPPTTNQEGKPNHQKKVALNI
eukprot:10538336-Ditylum_brightwellii.AAC.1